MKTVIFSIFLLIFLNSNSQDIKINEVFDNTGKIVRIDYINNETYDTNSIYVNKHNPYINLKYPKRLIELPAITYNGYNISNVGKSAIYEKFYKHYYQNDSLFEDINFDVAIVNTLVKKYKEYRFLQYRLIFEDNNRCTIGILNTILILNKSGEIISKIINSVFDFESGVITNDGKYLAYRHVLVDESCGNLLPKTTILIYDLINHKYTHKFEEKEEYWLNYPTTRNNSNFFIVRYNHKNGYTYNIIIPGERTYYSRYFSKQQKSHISKITIDGIRIKEDNVETLQEYNSHLFQKNIF